MKIAVVGGDSRRAERVHWPDGYEVRHFPGQKWGGNGALRAFKRAVASGDYGLVVKLTRWNGHPSFEDSSGVKKINWPGGLAALADALPEMAAQVGIAPVVPAVSTPTVSPVLPAMLPPIDIIYPVTETQEVQVQVETAKAKPNERVAQAVEFITKNPGRGSAELVIVTGMSTTLAAQVLARAVKQGLLTRGDRADAFSSYPYYPVVDKEIKAKPAKIDKPVKAKGTATLGEFAVVTDRKVYREATADAALARFTKLKDAGISAGIYRKVKVKTKATYTLE